MTPHAASAAGSEARVIRKSAGILCTTSVAISFSTVLYIEPSQIALRLLRCRPNTLFSFHALVFLRHRDTWARSLFIALVRSISAIRGFGFAVGLYKIVGFQFAIAFCLLIDGPNLRVLWFYASCSRLCSGSPPWPYTSSVLGNGGPHRWLHRSALVCSTFIHHVDHPLAICNPSRLGDRHRHGHGSDRQSLHGILG
jgi:hypothetical protein